MHLGSRRCRKDVSICVVDESALLWRWGALGGVPWNTDFGGGGIPSLSCKGDPGGDAMPSISEPPTPTCAQISKSYQVIGLGISSSLLEDIA